MMKRKMTSAFAVAAMMGVATAYGAKVTPPDGSAAVDRQGQGVAYACRELGVTARIYLPRTTPRQKRERVSALGGPSVEVVVGGDVYDDASAAADEDAEATGAAIIPAFDAVQTMAGQGTIAPEIVAELGAAPDVVVVPVGGGGLLGGVATWFAERHPGTRVVGVEPAGAASARSDDAPDRGRRGPRLTEIGRRLARLPIDPRLGRMLLEAGELGCVGEVMVIVAALSIQDVRERPVEKPAGGPDEGPPLQILLVARLLEIGAHHGGGVLVRAFARQAHLFRSPKAQHPVAPGDGLELLLLIEGVFGFEGLFPIVEGRHFAQQAPYAPIPPEQAPVYSPLRPERNLT